MPTPSSRLAQRPRARRWWPLGSVLVLAALIVGWQTPHPLAAQSTTLYVAQTGHTISNEYGFLDYWRAQESTQVLGAPVTEQLREGGIPVQYFEYARLEAHPSADGTALLHGLIGSDYARALWRQFAPAPAGTAHNTHAFAESDYTLREPFLSFWREQGGLDAFGYPISEPLWEYSNSQLLEVQYFERARLEHHPLAAAPAEQVRATALGRALAELRGYDTAPLPAPVVATPVPTAAPAPVAAAAPAPVAAAASAPVAAAAPVPVASGGKAVVVNISHQWLYAYEGGVLVFDAPVTTGKDGFNTPVGSYRIYAKVPLQTMSGTLGGEYYNVPNVPHAMYINGGVALHGTYWHNLFGSGVRISHGCINLPLGSAAWLYSWAPMGTPVQVTY